MNTVAALPHIRAWVSGDAGDARWRFGPVTPSDAVTVRDFIRDGFFSAYGARIGHFLPHLHALRRGTELMAACGLRDAAHETLFLETYLDEPVEQALAAYAGHAVERAGIVEVGNLNIARPGLGRQFIAHLTRHLNEAGLEWTVFTAVPALRNNFRRLGVPIATLGPARLDRVPVGERTAWGSYYHHGPVVCAVKVADAYAVLGAAP